MDTFIVEGKGDGGDYLPEGQAAPFLLFCPEIQDWLPKGFDTRAEAEAVCLKIRGAMTVMSDAFKAYGAEWESYQKAWVDYDHANPPKFDLSKTAESTAAGIALDAALKEAGIGLLELFRRFDAANPEVLKG